MARFSKDCSLCGAEILVADTCTLPDNIAIVAMENVYEAHVDDHVEETIESVEDFLVECQ